MRRDRLDLPPRLGRARLRDRAARALLAFAFETLRVHRVVARLHPENVASVRMCDRLGMRREAHMVEDLWNKGAWEDTGVYAILAREWHGAAPPAR